MLPIRKILVDIQETQSFEQLESFKHPKVWKTLGQEERLLLARLVVMQGAQQLAQGNHQVLESFEIAAQISSYAIEILQEQGNILASYRENARCLALACQVFAHVLQQDSTFLMGWYARARVLMDIGLLEDDTSYLLESSEHFEKVEELLKASQATMDRGEFYWKWGLCLASLGKLSGEPLEFHRALEKYYVAYDLGYRAAPFLNDYGQSFADLGSLLDKRGYLLEALTLFAEAVHQDPTSFDSLYNEACYMYHLGECLSYELMLEEAEHDFAKAAQLDPMCGQLWLKWGQLETSIGKLTHNCQKLEASLGKFARAYQLETDYSQVLSCWAEAELLLGAQGDRLDLIRSAEAKILKSLEIQPEDAYVWYLYGICLNELGHYFEEVEYYHQAIEKFHYGLSLKRHFPLLWYGLALSHFALGEWTGQRELIEKAVGYCSRVMEVGGEGFAQFWNDWGVALLKLAELTNQSVYVEAAIQKFENALKQPLRNIDFLKNLRVEDLDLEWVYNYGCAFDLLGDLTEESRHFERAIHILSQVIQLDPTYTQARYNLALALSHLGEVLFDIELYYKAIEHFQLLVDQDPEDEMVYLDFGISLTNLALLVHDVHHPERSQWLYRQAENHLLQAAALGNAQAYYQLAGLYSITGNYDQAMHYLERAQFFGTLPGIEDLLHDEWLEGLRQMPSFRRLINELSNRQSTDD